MPLYHTSFKGRKNTAHFKPLRRIQVLLSADSIYDVEEALQDKYEFITGLCVTNCEATGLDLFEISS